MRKILTLTFVVLTTALQAQTFEGYLKWTMNMEVTDPAMKKQLEQAKKFAKEPANQKAYKEAVEKMKDPDFRAKLEQNPQLKKEIQVMMAMMSLADGGVIPAGSMTLKVKGKSSYVVIDGPLSPGTTRLHIGEEDASYVVNHNTKEFKKVVASTDSLKGKDKTITKTSETEKIMGYNCLKYVVSTVSSKGAPVTYDYWTTTEIEGINPGNSVGHVPTNGAAFLDSDIEGVPLRVETQMAQGRIIFKVLEIEKVSLPDSEFQIPEGYTEKKS